MPSPSESPQNSAPPSGSDWTLDEAAYRAIVEHIPTITYIADWTPEADLRYVSPQIEAVLGFPAEAFVTDRDLWYARVHPDDLERVRAAERRAYEQEETYDLEFRMIAADGRELWFRELDTVIRDEDGRLQRGGLGRRGIRGLLRHERHTAQQLVRDER